jgi:hypothetical protein
MKTMWVLEVYMRIFGKREWVRMGVYPSKAKVLKAYHREARKRGALHVAFTREKLWPVEVRWAY